MRNSMKPNGNLVSRARARFRPAEATRLLIKTGSQDLTSDKMAHPDDRKKGSLGERDCSMSKKTQIEKNVFKWSR